MRKQDKQKSLTQRNAKAAKAKRNLVLSFAAFAIFACHQAAASSSKTSASAVCEKPSGRKNSINSPKADQAIYGKGSHTLHAPRSDAPTLASLQPPAPPVTLSVPGFRLSV